MSDPSSLNALSTLRTTRGDPLQKRPSMFVAPKGKDWDKLSETDRAAKLKRLQDRVLEKELRMKQLILLRNASKGKLPPGIADEEARFFGVKKRQFQQLVANYEKYQERYRSDPSAGPFFMPLPIGRKKGRTLLDKQKDVIHYALAQRYRTVRSALGRERAISVPFRYRDVYDFAKSIYPMPSYDTVARYIKDIEVDRPAMFKYMTLGAAVVEREFLLKKRNDAERPNQRWQSDARDLPFYVVYKGQVCPVCLLIIYDDYSKYIIWWRLIPKVKAGGSTRKRMTFTAEDVCSLYATAMYLTGVRFEENYTDNGSQYLAAEKSLLQCLTSTVGSMLSLHHTRPRKPWGRGKVENALGQVSKLLARLPGSYVMTGNKYTNRLNIQAAKSRNDLYEFDEAVAEFAKHFKNLVERPRKHYPSRYDIWRSVISSPAPPIRHLALMEKLTSRRKEVTLDSWSVHFNGMDWEPKVISGENQRIYKAWLDAAAAQQLVTLVAVKLDIGWRAEVNLGGEWIEIVPKSTQRADIQHNQDQALALKDLRQEADSFLKTAEEAVREIRPDLPVLDAASGDYDADLPAPFELSSTKTSSERKHGSRTTGKGKTSPSQRAATPKPVQANAAASEAQAQPLPDMEAILAQTRAQLQEGRS